MSSSTTCLALTVVLVSPDLVCFSDAHLYIAPDSRLIGFSHYDYPGTYDPQYFHHCGTPGDDIQDFSNRFQVQNCELANLAECVIPRLHPRFNLTHPSLATETDYVRGKLVDHANDLLSLGVDGLRIDAAKRKSHH